MRYHHKYFKCNPNLLAYNWTMSQNPQKTQIVQIHSVKTETAAVNYDRLLLMLLRLACNKPNYASVSQCPLQLHPRGHERGSVPPRRRRTIATMAREANTSFSRCIITHVTAPVTMPIIICLFIKRCGFEKP